MRRVYLIENDFYLRDGAPEKRLLGSILCGARPVSKAEKIICYILSIEKQPRKGCHADDDGGNYEPANPLQPLIESRHSINERTQAQARDERNCHRPRKRHQTDKEAESNDPRPARALVGFDQTEKRQCRAGSRRQRKLVTTRVHHQEWRRGHNNRG